MDKNAVEERIKTIAADIAGRNGFELVHTEFAGAKKNLTLRIYVDKPGGITLDDCSLMSREVEAVLDVDDLIPDPYLLEVSSPGLERQLYSIADFEKFAGRKAKVKTLEPVGGQSNFTGRIEGVDDGETIVFDDRTAGVVKIPYSAVAKANLKVDLHEEFKKKH